MLGIICDLAITAIGVSIGSHHFTKNPDLDYNEFNPGIFVEINDKWLTGLYLNSYSKPTLLLARDVPVAEIGPFGISILAGVATGYKIPLMVAGRVKSRWFDVVVIPPSSGTSAAVSLIVKKEFR